MPGLDVFEGAIRIARAEYPRLDPAEVREAVAVLAAEARGAVDGRGRSALERFHELFFGRWGFHGNREAYYDPRNSFVNDVLDRRTGIPISLATVYAEIARRLGLAVRGVAFPGHFLARWNSGRSTAIIDCFNGRLLSVDDCRGLLKAVAPAEPPERLASYLAATTPGRILSRMLGNLRQIHGRDGDHARVLRWIDLEIEFNPVDAEAYRDRAVVHARRHAFGAALDDLERYLRLSPGAPDAEDVRRQVLQIRRRLAEMN